MTKKTLLVILFLVVILTSACANANGNSTQGSSPVLTTQIAGSADTPSGTPKLVHIRLPLG
jgi:ABC-type Fe3+-citrate transport system substrate-binding protein